jgi:protein-tyrosine sulfotransferase
MRAILDTQGSILCGSETQIGPYFLTFVREYLNLINSTTTTTTTTTHLESPELAHLRNSMGIFIAHLIRKEPSKRLCMKDPLILQHIVLLHQIFPRAKFVYMVRDGRSSVDTFVKKLLSQRGNPNTTDLAYKVWIRYSFDFKVINIMILLRRRINDV